MEPIKIVVNLPCEIALAAGRTQHGYSVYSLTDEDVAALDDDGRAYVARLARSLANKREAQPVSDCLELRIAGPDVSSATVLAALRAISDEKHAQVARERVESESRIQEALAAPDSAWLDGDAGIRQAPSIDTGFLCDEETRDPRIIARRAAVESGPALAEKRERIIVAALSGDGWPKPASLCGGYSHWDMRPWYASDPRVIAKAAEATAKIEQEKRDAAEQTKRYADLCRAYVREFVPEFARAAADGCDVNKRAEKHAEQIVEARLTANRLGEDTFVLVTNHLTDATAHTCPTQHAYDTLDKVRAILTERELPAPIASAETRIVRIDTCPVNGCTRGIRTAIEVELTWRDGEMNAKYVYADTAPEHEHAEQDDDDE